MKDADIARWRLRSLRLVEPFAGSAEELVQGLLAVQAENVGQTAWAVATRTRRKDAAELAGLLDDGAVLRTHVLRPTWHYVSAEDIVWLLELTAPRVQRVTGTQLRVAHDLTGADLVRAMDTVVAAVSERAPLTRSQLAEALAQRGLPLAGQGLMLLLAHVELAGLICSGPPAGGQHTYALLTDRVPPVRRRERDEGLAELALRYAVGHGPATERDLAYWATLPLGDARRGLAAVADRLERFTHEGRTFWHAPGEKPQERLTPRAHVLQILDECYRGYQDSRWVLDAAGVVPRGRETSTGMALVDGQLVATVRRVPSASLMLLDIAPFRTLQPAERHALKAAARARGEFYGQQPEITFAET